MFKCLRSIVIILIVFLSVATANGQEPNSLLPKRNGDLKSRVSPVLEIEIVEPNRDPRGNPAIQLKNDPQGNTQVSIPPSLIVHRYYYTGDRSFRGPDFPGGPSIIVAQHPRTGEQVYLPVQMLPGSAIVTYSKRSIEYDFGDRAVIVSFPMIGNPTVSYRAGRPFAEKAGKLTGISLIKQASGKGNEAWDGIKTNVEQRGKALGSVARNLATPLTLPAQHLARLVPGHAALTDPSLQAKLLEDSELRQRERELARTKASRITEQIDIPRLP